MSELLLLVIMLGSISVALLLLERVAAKGKLRGEIARKVLHIYTGTVIAFMPILVPNKLYLYLTGLVVGIVLFLGVYLELFPSIHEKHRKSWGMFYFPVSFLLLLVMWTSGSEWVFSITFLVLAFSDAAAAIVGRAYGVRTYVITGDHKTYLGSAAFFIVTLAILLLFGFDVVHPAVINLPFSLSNPLLFVIVAVIVSFVLTVIEAVSSKGIDNLTIPVFGCFFLFALFSNDQAVWAQIGYAFIFALPVAFLSYKAKFLTKDGAVTTFLMAMIVFGFGSWQWSLPLLTFFILSSVLSKLRKKKNKNVEHYFEKSGVRDFLQVLANGGLSAIVLLVSLLVPSPFFYLLYVGTLAAVCADTWATEIGTFFKQPTYNITTWKRTEQGRSGGVSVIGTLGSLAGAFVVVYSASFWLQSWKAVFILTSVGLLGSIIDSILGAAVQAHYQCASCSIITEKRSHCGVETHHHSGTAWIDNDAVNFLSAMLSSAVFTLLYFFVTIL